MEAEKTDKSYMHFMATLPIHPLFLEEDEENVVETSTTLAPKVKASSRTVQRDLVILSDIINKRGYVNLDLDDVMKT